MCNEYRFDITAGVNNGIELPKDLACVFWFYFYTCNQPDWPLACVKGVGEQGFFSCRDQHSPATRVNNAQAVICAAAWR